MKRNYAIIDHIGTLDKEQRDLVYSIANKHAEKDGFQPKPWKDGRDVFTLKTVAQDYSPYAKEVSQAMKNRARNEKEPKKVYIVCENYTDNVEWNEEKWASRMRKVFIEDDKGAYYYAWIQTEVIAAVNDMYMYGEVLSTARREALIWANALGWTFSTPLIRESQLSSPDVYIRNSNYDRYFPKNTSLEVRVIEYKGEEKKLPYDSFYTSNDTFDERFNERQTIKKSFMKVKTVSRSPVTNKILRTTPVTYILEQRTMNDYSQASKISTKPSTYRNNNLKIATEKECREFQVYLHWLMGEDLITFGNGKPRLDANNEQQFKKTRKSVIEEFLAENYTLCPECRKPIKKSPSKTDIFESTTAKEITEGMMQCNHCDVWIPIDDEDICFADTDTFYDDSYFDEENERYEFEDREIEETDEEDRTF